MLRQQNGRLLDFKEGQQYAISAEAKEFQAPLGELELPRGTLLVVMPGHEASATNAGTPLARAVARLVASDGRLMSSMDALIRFRDIEKLASGGDRSVAVHLGSIRVQEPPPVRGATVVVLDDIVTTGNSMEAVRQLLTTAGANRVAGIAIGRTVR